MIVPGSFYISCKLDVRSYKDKKGTIVPNIGRKINIINNPSIFNHNTTVTIGEFLTTKYALVLDLRGSYDDSLHGNELELKDEMTVEIKRITSGSGKLRLHVFLVQDAQIGIQKLRVTGDSY